MWPQSRYQGPSARLPRHLARKASGCPGCDQETPAAASGGTSEPTEATFREAALEKGFTTYAVEGLLGIIKGDYATGITIGNKTAEEVETLNAKFAPKSDGDLTSS